MAESSTIKDKVEKLRKQRSRGFIKNLIFIVIIATLAGVGFISIGMKNVFFFLLLALLPALLSIVWDKKPGRFASKTVVAFNVTGMFPFLLAIASSGTPDSVALTILHAPNTWILVYGFAIFGWSVILLIPKITMIFLEIKSRYMVKRMEKFQQELLEEWGEEIRK